MQILLRSHSANLAIAVLVSLAPIGVAITGPVSAKAQSLAVQFPVPRPSSQLTFRSRPLREEKQPAHLKPEASSQQLSLPLWDYTVTSPADNLSYTATMVGKNPFLHGHRTTSVQAFVVPVRMQFAATKIAMDPGVANGCALNYTVTEAVRKSPIFTSTNFGRVNASGTETTQYIDAYQRANLWQPLAGSNYHLLLQYQPVAEATVTVPAQYGTTAYAPSACGAGLLGYVDIDWWDSYVQTTLIPSLSSTGVAPDSLVIFIFAGVVMVDSQGDLIGGYHSAYSTSRGVQTYITANFDAEGHFVDANGTANADVGPLSHEIGEWLVNPLIKNLAPSWGNVGQEKGCSNELEVGDPLSDHLLRVPTGSLTYFPQDLAFVSWFFRQAPGSSGVHSYGGNFGRSAGPLCR